MAEDRFNLTPASFIDLNDLFPVLNEKVGLSAEQFRVVVENINWNRNHLSQADIQVGTINVTYAAPGTPFDVKVTHRGEYDDHNCLIADILDFDFTMAVADIDATASATLNENAEDGASAKVDVVAKEDKTGFDFNFTFAIPRGIQGVQGVSFRNRGNYNENSTYVNNETYIDYVHYEGNVYCPNVAETTAGTLPTDTNEWTLMMRRGYGISNIEHTKVDGLVHTYTITLESGYQYTFDVTDGVTPDTSGKADKVAGATSGNFAGLDADGNLTDSGKKPSDFEAIGNKATEITDDNLESTTLYPTIGAFTKYVDDLLGEIADDMAGV